MTTWVVNTSPLIFLARLGHLEILRRGAEFICVPQAVLDEIQAKPDEAAHAIEQAIRSWLSVRPVSARDAVEFLQADLDLGEAEVIVLARELRNYLKTANRWYRRYQSRAQASLMRAR